MMRRRRPLDPRELVGPGLIAMLAAGLIATFITAFALSGGEPGAVEVTPTATPGGTPGTTVSVAMVPPSSSTRRT